MEVHIDEVEGRGKVDILALGFNLRREVVEEVVPGALRKIAGHGSHLRERDWSDHHAAAEQELLAQS